MTTREEPQNVRIHRAAALRLQVMQMAFADRESGGESGP